MFFKNYDYLPPDYGRPIPEKLMPFIWHFVRQMKMQFILIFILFSLSAIILSIIPYFIQVFVEALEQVESKEDVWSALQWPIIGFFSFILVIQPILAQAGNYVQARTLPHFSGLIRRQLALYMHQHSYDYYQNDFAGRLAGKVIETPTAINDVVYSFNILTIKLFARSQHEDQYFGESISKTSDAFRENDFELWRLWTFLEVITTAIWVVTILAAVYGWQVGTVSTAQFAMILPLTLQVTQTSWWISEILTNVFQRLGEIQEGIESMIKKQHVLDKDDARALMFSKGDIEFKNVSFAYGAKNVIKNLNLKIPSGQKVGLIGESGAGKSTLVQIFLRLYDINDGHIMMMQVTPKLYWQHEKHKRMTLF